MIETLLFLLTGSLAGLLSGLLGIGGGVVVVPLLAAIFEANNFPKELTMHFAAGTSLAVMVVTTSASLRAHVKRGKSVWPIFKLMLPGLVPGVIVGGLIADYLASHTLRILFGILLIFVAIKTYYSGHIRSQEQEIKPSVMAFAGSAAGVLSGLLGIGGGATIVPFLLYLSLDIRVAVAVSTACGMLIGVIGTITYMITGLNEVYTLSWATGHIYWPAFLWVSIASPIFATLGAHISHKLPVNILRAIFALFLLLAAAKLLIH